jgi:general secretion pathway protein C
MKNIKIFVFFFVLPAFFYAVLIPFLQTSPVNYINIKNSKHFYNINLTKLFFNTKSSEIKPIKNITKLNFKLKALYSNGKKGFIIINDNKKNIFINLNETYKGYKLIKINLKSAVFKRNQKRYIISLSEKTDKNYTYDNTSENTSIVINKKTFKEYKNNLSKIWSNIGIIKTKEGYTITYIKKGSVFDKIGLKKGDILLEVNGVRLKNDADAWRLYKNIDKYRNFEIIIKRKNQTKVLNYEID